MKTITKAQDLQLQMLGLCRFNKCDGQSVVLDLQSHSDFWRSVQLGREVSPLHIPLQNPTESDAPHIPLKNKINLIALRDFPQGQVNMDSLYILTEAGRQDALQEVAKGWNASEVCWIDYKEAFHAMGASRFSMKDLWGDQRVILRVWWE
jgi:hypothetical protein